MKDRDQSRHAPISRDCARIRLAETDIGSVDVCDCGMWQLNMGALTLRFAPAAVSDLLALLGQAVAEHSGRRLTAAEHALALELSGFGRRGDA
jgi:hypothetical protein